MKFFKSKCFQGGERHNFKPFYIEDKPDLLDIFRGQRATSGFVERIMESATKHVYQFHICNWCGKKIKMEE